MEKFSHFLFDLVGFHFIFGYSQSVQSFMRRRRNADRSGKGLRHFSMKVCKKVEEKGTTTYNEVADELVEEVCLFLCSHTVILAIES